MNDETIDVIAICQSAMENKFAFIQPEKRLNRQLPINTARTDRQNLLKSFLLKYWPINHMPMVIITRPKAAGVDIFRVKAADIQENASEEAYLEDNQKKVLTTSAMIPAVATPSIHFIADISALIAINRASISLRKLLISCCKSFVVDTKSSLVARLRRLRSKISDKTSASATACGRETPTASSLLTNLSVSNATAAIVNISCLQILAQEFLFNVYTRKAANEGEFYPWSLI